MATSSMMFPFMESILILPTIVSAGNGNKIPVHEDTCVSIVTMTWEVGFDSYLGTQSIQPSIFCTVDGAS